MATDAARVFVSHANADKAYVSKFVDNLLIRGAGLNTAQIFYTSAADTGVPSGQNLMEVVRQEAGSSHLFIALVTPVYQTRPVCVAELGAAWARDLLFPIMSPGMDRSELEGVLPGRLIKTSDDDEVLDELADRLRKIGFDVATLSWGIGKAAWKASLRAGSAPAALPPVPTIAQLKRLESELEATQAALDEANKKLQDQLDRNAKLNKAKSVAEVREANLPSDERERFDAIREATRSTLREVTGVVSDAIWHQVSGQEMHLPDRMDAPDSHDAILEEAKKGRLDVDRENGEVALDTEYPEVEEALTAAHELAEFLHADDRSEHFASWFKEKFKVPMNLAKKGCWDAIL
ncbi:toll/interleukin-1 receptor domain-containing protein [Glutamicibacter sp. BW77]|uniref:toll/interleukin-1 receptor domain-containing protein n=1 Tax=Glutamicibacter sp. BW77 TaxID=2024402 RepID=UPI000BB6BE9D|nr:toll/interleukin-1 receptor domain-containing protein [Glutamicibacter sp. BW77]PCC32030.1 hypothetical protein CIK74_16275 [Glutamicibacter sp. BW77]